MILLLWGFAGAFALCIVVILLGAFTDPEDDD